MSDARIDDLEFRLAHQDKLIDELNQALCEQQNALGKLLPELRRLAERVRDLEQGRAGGAEAPGEELPPHY